MIEFRHFGLCPFDEMRRIQNEYVQSRIKGSIPDTVIFCEHPPTLSLGKRSHETDLLRGLDYWREIGVEVVQVDRGGGPTYHGPGQLLIYPVISLRAASMGVKVFVERGLSALAASLGEFGLELVSTTNPAGIWISDALGGSALDRKIGSVGLRVAHGVSNHGFSLNIDCDLKPFSFFHACGLKGVVQSSVVDELDGTSPTIETIKECISGHLCRVWHGKRRVEQGAVSIKHEEESRL